MQVWRQCIFKLTLMATANWFCYISDLELSFLPSADSKSLTFSGRSLRVLIRFSHCLFFLTLHVMLRVYMCTACVCGVFWCTWFSHTHTYTHTHSRHICYLFSKSLTFSGYEPNELQVL